MIEMTTEILFEHLQHLVRSPLMHGLIIAMVFDILTGYAKAFKLKRFDSKVGTNGIIRHILVLMMVFIVGTYSRALGHVGVSVGTCTFFLTNYLISVAENWEALGLPFPPQLKPFFNQMRKNSDAVLAKELKVDMLKVEDDEGGD
ncbi:holin [Atopobacter sp. AH10]|uniref:phage holin family protein n=1 Tax=Atopobacter sp. AH10 TaxID=2315861 RepID=UPI000EF1AF21|nr:phage holin family protein [Atopobacter sp. AH10]RLK63140.1 holin [Atopobacter sp. AH10]